MLRLHSLAQIGQQLLRAWSNSGRPSVAGRFSQEQTADRMTSPAIEPVSPATLTFYRTPKCASFAHWRASSQRLRFWADAFMHVYLSASCTICQII